MTISLEDIQAWQRVVGATPDGKPGPADTFPKTIAWFRDHGFIAPPVLPSEARARVVAIARAEIGLQRPEKYAALVAPFYVNALRANGNAKAWCGVFALWCLRQAGLCDWDWIDGRGFAEPHSMPKVRLPEPGDIGYLIKASHYFIVEDVVGAGKVLSIDGNHYTAPAEGVGTAKRDLGDVTAFYSIRNLVP